MPNANLCVMMGHLTADPELKQLQSGTVVCEFAIAVHRYIKQDEQDVIFMPVTVWGKMGESCKKYLRKGSCAHVTGFLKQENWQTQEGGKRSMIKLVADAVQFITRPNDDGGQRQQHGSNGSNGGHRYSAADCPAPERQSIDPAYGPQSNVPANANDDIPF